MATVPSTYTIALHDPRQDTDDEVAERVALSNLIDQEILPDDPPTPVDQAIAMLRSLPDRVRLWSFRARDPEGTLVGLAGTSVDPEHDDNPDLFGVRVVVHPQHRRRGVGHLLLGELAGLARQEDRSRLLGSTWERVPAGEAFARAAGAEPKTAEHLNHLPVAEVDRTLLEGWVAAGPSRAADYELVVFDGPAPDDLLEGHVDAILIMNTAPRDDLEINDFTLTPEQVRESERTMEAGGIEVWTLIARHAATGEVAGYHDVMWQPHDPTVVWIGATGVKPDHRGHALGKWLKAVMTLRILDQRPDVVDIRTGNADSNDAMLGINREMGYRPMFASTTWELAVPAGVPPTS